jgi:hypothetical protein
MLLSTGQFFNGGGGAPPGATGFYAFVNKTGDQSSFDTVALTWEAEVSDAENIHDNSTNNSRFTIPAAWNNRYVRLTGNNVSNAIGGVLAMWKDGADFMGLARYDYASTSGNNACNVMSAPVLAVTGNYFEFQGTVNTGDLFADNGTWGQIEMMPSDFNGALVKKTTDQSISAGVTTTLTWDAEEYDLDGWHDNSTNNSRLTVPTGVSLVRVQAGFRGGNVTDQLVISFLKDGAGARGLPQNDTDSTGFDSVCAASAPIAVSATNYFEVRAFHASATDIAADNMTWFSIHELPSDLKYALVNRSSNQAISSGTNTIINWNAEVADTDGWHDNSSNTSRLTVPSGVSKVRVGFNLITEASVLGQLIGEILKNGSSFLGKARHETDTSGGDSVGGWTAILDVTPGDYFEVQVFATNAINIGSNNASWFAIEEVRDAT